MAEPLKLFPIQLRRVGVAEVKFGSPGFPQLGKPFAKTVNLTTAIGSYNSTDKYIHVFLTAAAEDKTIPNGANLSVRIVGEFYVADESKLPFPIDKLPAWAGSNGAMVLMPFLRNHFHSITQLGGYSPLIFPLLEVTAFRVLPPEGETTTSKEAENLALK